LLLEDVIMSLFEVLQVSLNIGLLRVGMRSSPRLMQGLGCLDGVLGGVRRWEFSVQSVLARFRVKT
jgi:hypothetical protein